MKSIQLKKSLLLGFTAISCLLLIGPSTATALTIRGCTIVNQARGGYSYTSCPGKNFTNADLTGVDLRGADLRGAKFAGANFRGAQIGGLTSVMLT